MRISSNSNGMYVITVDLGLMMTDITCDERTAFDIIRRIIADGESFITQTEGE